jgi:hypothetical protein
MVFDALDMPCKIEAILHMDVVLLLVWDRVSPARAFASEVRMLFEVPTCSKHSEQNEKDHSSPSL